MRSRPKPVVWLTLFWLIVGGVYVWAAWQQKERVNLSAAAGGQYPYLVYAQGMAEEGVTQYFGDRNRLPLYPALLSPAYDGDWDRFVERSAWFAIASSLVILAGIGGLSYATLPGWSATALTLAAAVCVFIPKSSFVQAELLYYGLLLASWLLLSRLIRQPRVRLAIPTGVLLALTYLTKASGAAALIAFIAAAAVQAITLMIRPQREPTDDRNVDMPVRWRDVTLSAAIVVVVFGAIAYPYLSNNKARFGRYFYNVNSTFFMWCDSWPQAKAFGDQYRVSEHFPQAPPDEIPGPVNYWKTHSARQMLGRLTYGFRALGSLALRGPYLKYFALAALFCVVLGIRQRRSWPRPGAADWPLGLFCALFFGGYLLSYAWYAQVAYGDRFLLSLFLPAMYAALWLGQKLAERAQRFPLLGWRLPMDRVVAVVLTVLLLGEGAAIATTSLYQPGRAFVQFYYSESRELQAGGNLDEAARGFAGVIRLDPDYAPAHHGLGMIALATGRFDAAVVSLSEAVRLAPEDADAHNSHGSALLQLGRTAEAVGVLRRAVELDPELAVGWYNLGGAYYRLGQIEEAQVVQRRLKNLDPKLAEQLAALLGS